MYPIKQSTTAQPLMFLMVDSTDHVTGKTGLTPTVTLSKNGAAFGAPAGAVTELTSGWYKVAGNATDTNTLGPLLLHATGAAADPTDVVYYVVSYDPQDAVRLGLTALPNAAAEAAGGLYTRGTGAGQLNQNANGQHDVRAVTLAADVITDTSLATSAGTELADAIADEVYEGTETLRQIIRLMRAIMLGATTGQPSSPVFKSEDGGTDRVTATVDGSGNRSSIVTDPS